MKKTLLITFVIALSLIVLSACTIKKEEQNMANEYKNEVVVKDTPEPTETSPEMHEPMNEMPIAGELTEEESTKYREEGLTVEQKIAFSEEIAMKMPMNGMEHIRTMFPDIQSFATIDSDDPRNMAQMGPESWEYSAEGDITVVVCNEIDSPVHVFEGKEITQNDIDEAIIMINDMMMGVDEETLLMSENEPGKYASYSEEIVATTPGKKVLFFHASWCPTCRSADKDLTASALPKGVTVFKTDYDSEDELKQKYAITSQHTFVQIDDNGNMLKKWTGGGSAEIIENI